jgi:hypothetical protein
MIDALVLTIPRALATPNRDRGAHWATRHRLTKVWEQEIWSALRKDRAWRAWLVDADHQERRRVTITRHHPTRRSFCKDADNRMFAGKGIRDCLTRLHLLVDDNDKWLESSVVDVKSPSGRAETIITIERLL